MAWAGCNTGQFGFGPLLPIPMVAAILSQFGPLGIVLVLPFIAFMGLVWWGLNDM